MLSSLLGILILAIIWGKIDREKEERQRHHLDR